MTGLRAVVFDVDGVLTDTAELHFRAWTELFDAVLGSDVAPFTREDYEQLVDGRSRLDGLRAVLARRNGTTHAGRPDDSTLESLARRKQELFLGELRRSGIRTFDDVERCLRRLDALHVDAAAASASRNARSVLDAAHLTSHFAAIIDGADAARRHLAGKPEPDLFAAAAALLGRRPEECALVEDSTAGIEAGRAGGFALVVGLDRSAKGRPSIAAAADLVISTLDDLPIAGIAPPAAGRDRAEPGAVGPGADWNVRFVVTNKNRRVVESLTTLSNGCFGTRGLVQRAERSLGPSTTAIGVYDSADVPSLLEGPAWDYVDIDVGTEHSEIVELDLFRGLLHTRIGGKDLAVEAVAFASLAQPGIHVLQIEGLPSALEPGPILRAPQPQPGVTVTNRSNPSTIAVESTRGTIVTCAYQDSADRDSRRSVTRTAGLMATTSRTDPSEMIAACHALTSAARSADVDALRTAHERAWAQRWRLVAIDLPADPALQSALRFAQFHLLSASHDGDEAAVGARGLTGTAYGGRVFWDTDVFVVPALAAMAPGLARAALGYRWRRLGAARQRAAQEGREGARFPWESADTGIEAAPSEAYDLQGNRVPILTGLREEHIVADVAWAACTYVDWTGDEGFIRTMGAPLLVETARYWQSRAEFDGAGAAHVRHVIGPDEYHEDVDDNAFTNLMAAWNLDRAASLTQAADLTSDGERRAWRHTAERLVDTFDSSRGIHEQFAGFFDLEPVMVDSIGQPPISADVIIGRDRIKDVQIIKQADVLMAHHMIAHRLPAGSVDADLDYYLPRTAHGSSLSPAITAAVLARAGRTDDALRWFDMAARFDLDDLSGTTAGGLHLATLGGLWQALTTGFLGIRPRADATLSVDPAVPQHWQTVTLRFVFHGIPMWLRASATDLEIGAEAPVDIGLAGATHRCDRRLEARRSRDGWEVR